MINNQAVERVVNQLTEMAEREELLLSEGLKYKQDQLAATAHAKAWRTAATLVRKVLK